MAAITMSTSAMVIMISGHGTIETAVRATKLGAYDFVEKPLTIEKVAVLVKNACQQRKLEREVERLKEADGKQRIIGESVPMKAVRQQLALMAGTNVVKLGEVAVRGRCTRRSTSRRTIKRCTAYSNKLTRLSALIKNNTSSANA